MADARKMRKLTLAKETVRHLTDAELADVDANGASGGTCPYCAIDADQDTTLCSKAVVGTCLSYAGYCDGSAAPTCAP